ncbi:hypothetical protein [Lactococcus lactis]|nr:hypothetical protein [Lactococcus lactis]
MLLDKNWSNTIVPQLVGTLKSAPQPLGILPLKSRSDPRTMSAPVLSAI